MSRPSSESSITRIRMVNSRWAMICSIIRGFGLHERRLGSRKQAPAGVVVDELITLCSAPVEQGESLVEPVLRAGSDLRIRDGYKRSIDTGKQYPELKRFVGRRQQSARTAAAQHDGGGVQRIDEHAVTPRGRMAEVDCGEPFRIDVASF